MADKSSQEDDQVTPVSRDEDPQSSSPSSPPVVAFSVAHALSMVRQRREREDQARQEKEKELAEQRRQRSREKRQRHRQNQKQKRAQLRDEAAEKASEDSRKNGVADGSSSADKSNDGLDNQGVPSPKKTEDDEADHEPKAVPSHSDEINQNSLPTVDCERLPSASTSHSAGPNESGLSHQDQHVKRPATSLIPRSLLVKKTKR